MNRRELIDYCLTYPDAYEDYPFDPLPDENATAVIRHKKNRRSFALILRHKGMMYLNLKCDPFEAELLRQAYHDLIPGWHMNKRHWNTVVMGGDVPKEEIERMIRRSWQLTL